MSDMKVDQILTQIRSLRDQTGINRTEADPSQLGAINVGATPKVDFGSMLKQSIDAVNETQKNASALTASFERGDQDVSLTQVMVNMQKSEVSFKAMVEVRNKFVDAYQEVMRMSM
ncbi:Flagellar hook-basal body complex protein FliE [Zhongshania aliphaticivorans]|uniref:Flagellar hook-basal body complex protein FliE n=1 Tax=Zhongshania aliphaticivorans TaxID=1470434 RepID=A0A5S9NJH5_9GAMM|nr:flagellar hook-basal body complex protein FliE [Zhongshania aliphaticivorans]CAA0090762.1 Flagellar hook-basal body complex protein FliE [Zhongshania aliphaticivorans]CAA0098264.1 Flagellar hook-basal body complex protein FliE [Zhongshania aliphaticivorans]